MPETTPPRAATRERIYVVDAQLASRQKRALRQFVLRDPNSWKPLTLMGVGLALVTVLAVISKGATTASIRVGLVSFPAVLVVCVLAALAGTLYQLNRRIDREAVAGRMLAFTLGQHTVRVRDYDSAQEFAYSAITRVEQFLDIVVISFGNTLWALPVELFEPVDLGVLRARAGKAGAPQVLLD